MPYVGLRNWELPWPNWQPPLAKAMPESLTTNLREVTNVPQQTRISYIGQKNSRPDTHQILVFLPVRKDDRVNVEASARILSGRLQCCYGAFKVERSDGGVSDDKDTLAFYMPVRRNARKRGTNTHVADVV